MKMCFVKRPAAMQGPRQEQAIKPKIRQLELALAQYLGHGLPTSLGRSPENMCLWQW